MLASRRAPAVILAVSFSLCSSVPAHALRPEPIAQSAGLEELESRLRPAGAPAAPRVSSRRQFLRDSAAGLAAAVAAANLLSPEELRGQAPAAPKGALAPLAAALGKDREIAVLVWNPRDLLRLRGFFDRAVQAGVTTVWIGGYKFSMLTQEQQQALVNQANKAGLRTLGFVDGAPDWVSKEASEKVVSRYYQALMPSLRALKWGRLRVAFGVDIEPYTLPAETGWNGDLSGYSRLLEEVILPEVERFRASRPENKAGAALTRFEPWWWRNGHLTEKDKAGKEYEIRGLKAIPGTDHAGMTYRNSTGEILEVLKEVLARAGETEGGRFLLGAETISVGEPAGKERQTFLRREGELGKEVLGAVEKLAQPDRDRFSGVFINFSSAVHADRVIRQWLSADPNKKAGLEEQEAQVEAVVAETAGWIDATLRRAPYGYGRLLATGKLVFEVMMGREDQWRYGVRVNVTRETDSEGLFTEGYACSDAALQIARRVRRDLQDRGVPEASVLIKDGRTGLWASDFFVEVELGDRRWVLSGTPGMPTREARFQPNPREYSPGSWDRFHRPDGFPLRAPGIGSVAPMSWIPLEEDRAILVSAGIDPGDGRMARPDSLENIGLDRPVRLLYQVSVLDLEGETNLWERSISVPVPKHRLREVRDTFARHPEWRGEVLSRLWSMGIQERRGISGVLTVDVLERVLPVFDEQQALFYDLLATLDEWPKEWDVAPPATAGLEEAQAALDRLAGKWKLANLDEVRIAAVSPAALATHPELRAFLGKSIAIGLLHFMVLPEGTDAGPLLDLLSNDEFQGPVFVMEFGDPGDPALDVFGPLAKGKGFVLLGREGIEGQEFLGLLRQILVNLAGVPPEQISAQDLQDLTQALLIQA